MTFEDLNILTCGTTGDVVSWDTLEEKGISHRSFEWFPSCDGK